jgi:hypothetical protein
LIEICSESPQIGQTPEECIAIFALLQKEPKIIEFLGPFWEKGHRVFAELCLFKKGYRVFGALFFKKRGLIPS